ncbi:aminopeptidase P family protein [bacterium]|nr:aminopeptidase P family protein [bacterium]
MRIDKVRKMIKTKHLDAALITDRTNIRFLCGYSGSNGLLLITPNKTIFFTDFRYKTQAPQEVKGAEIIFPKMGISLYEELAERPEIKTLSNIGFEKSLPYFALEILKNILPAKIEWRPMEDFLSKMRAVKNPQEIDKIREAVRAAETGLKATLPHLKPGIVERDFAAELEYNMRKAGAEKNSFDTIVVSGLRSAIVHGIAADKVIEAGDFVTIDYGAFVDGWASDITRTFIMGEPTAKQREIYELVYSAQASAIKAARAGISGMKLDKIARDIIDSAGYAEFFGHGLGHGLGLLVHDSPRVSSRAENILPVNSIITIEPGIYIPEFGGVRIEDDVLILEDGCEVLTSLPKRIEEIIIE